MPGRKPIIVSVKETGEKMLQVAKKLDTPEVFLKLTKIPNAEDAIANYTRYHLKCWVTIQRKVKPTLCSIK